MIFLYIHLLIGIICVTLFALSVAAMVRKFKTLYPDLHPPKVGKAKLFMDIFKIVIASFIPLFNIVLFKILMFDYDEMERKTISKMLRSCEETNSENDGKHIF